MRVELVKRQDRWDLYGEDGSKIASTLDGAGYKLSIKNCEAIESGYDLDELALNECINISKTNFLSLTSLAYIGEGFKVGFQKAIEILGDKKFSEDDLKLAYSSGWTQRHNAEGSYYGMQKEFIQSLQQTQFDVEIVEQFQEEEQAGTDLVWGKMTPMLDKDDCLILKRKV